MNRSAEPRSEKYQEFQEKMKNVPTICGYDSKDVAALKYRQLLEEVLEQFKLLEDNLEQRKKIEAEIVATRLHLQACNKQKIEEARGK